MKEIIKMFVLFMAAVNLLATCVYLVLGVPAKDMPDLYLTSNMLFVLVFCFAATYWYCLSDED